MNSSDLKVLTQELVQLHRELHEDLRRQLLAMHVIDAGLIEVSAVDLEARARLQRNPICLALLEDIDRVRAALERAREARLGICIGCGEEIELNRLRADPSIAYCVSCTHRMERQAAYS